MNRKFRAANRAATLQNIPSRTATLDAHTPAVNEHEKGTRSPPSPFPPTGGGQVWTSGDEETNRAHWEAVDKAIADAQVMALLGLLVIVPWLVACVGLSAAVLWGWL